MRAPVLAIGDGALGFWVAVRYEWPETRSAIDPQQQEVRFSLNHYSWQFELIRPRASGGERREYGALMAGR